ncbi:helix-turn-helix domain-containing protein [Parasegetibacter sp. MAH-26]|uniref:Helix-turn-helix domain-containing protein n=1 Tax=Pinibacter aurantiacus TaxID=2851599 RepID=A0A9E2SAI0_9BACT|nr:helix-turn-helix domain-containing protein [Pinibacter aurantiacus]
MDTILSKLKLNRIKVALIENDRTNKDLALHLNKTEATVSRWCTNEMQPSIETLYAISKYLKVDIRELLVSTAK